VFGGIKMKKSRLFLLMIVLVVFVMNSFSCKEGDGVDTQYTLIVNISAGVTGTPATGTYTYTQGDLVTYNYTLLPGFSNLTVTLDGSIVAPGGSINMSNNRTLSATAVGGSGDFDIRGDWTATETYPPEGSQTQTFTFTGSKTSGDVTIEFPGVARGTYTVTGSSVTFHYTYTDGDSGLEISHNFSGSFTNANNMSGTCSITGGSEVQNGTWTASR
jgi:hypothetical protein